MDIKKDILWRVYLSFFAMMALALAVATQAFNVQVVNGERYRGLADSMSTRVMTVKAERGNIYSDDGRLLATSLPYFEIRMDASDKVVSDELWKANVDSLAWYMASMWPERNKRYYLDRLNQARKKGNRYLLIKRKVNYPDLQMIKTWPIFRRGRYRGGMIINQSNKRKIPFGLLAHRSIGYVRTGKGAQSVGLESAFNEYLEGINGKQVIKRISGSTWMPLDNGRIVEPRNGADLITTLDVNMQDVAENALKKTLVKNRADHGCAIVMEVKTGKIKAIANLGKIDENHYWETYNYAIGESTEPGSTFKLATMMALLEDDLLKLEDSVDIGNGRWVIFDRVMKDSEWHNHGKVSVKNAFEISSNVGIAKIAHQYYGKSADKFVNRLRSFGLNEKIGVELKGEGSPLIKSPGDEGWSAISIPWMSIGYEVSLTPLQLLAFFNAVANDGIWIKPYIASEIQEYGKTVRTLIPKQDERKICSPETVKKLQSLLEGVVEHGTARNIRNNNYTLAGKTGTARIADKKRGYKQKIYQSSFAGYFPADNPKYSCVVVVNAPSNGLYYGSSVAAPVFEEIANKLYASSIMIDEYTEPHLAGRMDTIDQHIGQSKGYYHDFEYLYSWLDQQYTLTEEAPTWIEGQVDEDTLKVKPLTLIQNLAPNVYGMGLRDAVYLLENSGLQVRVRGIGKVRYQSIRPGVRIQKGDKITIDLG